MPLAPPIGLALLRTKPVQGTWAFSAQVGAGSIASPGASHDGTEGPWLSFNCVSESAGLIKTKLLASDSVGLGQAENLRI